MKSMIVIVILVCIGLGIIAALLILGTTFAISIAAAGVALIKRLTK